MLPVHPTSPNSPSVKARGGGTDFLSSIIWRALDGRKGGKGEHIFLCPSTAATCRGAKKKKEKKSASCGTLPIARGIRGGKREEPLLSFSSLLEMEQKERKGGKGALFFLPFSLFLLPPLAEGKKREGGRGEASIPSLFKFHLSTAPEKKKREREGGGGEGEKTYLFLPSKNS